MRLLFALTIATAFALPITAQAGHSSGGGGGKVSAAPTGSKGGNGTKKSTLCQGVCGESTDDKHKGVMATTAKSKTTPKLHVRKAGGEQRE
jgi:hypothetical protein